MKLLMKLKSKESYMKQFNNYSYNKVKLAKDYVYKDDQDIIYIKESNQ